MSAALPLRLPSDDKLDLLRYLDEFHYWHSLDDERLCKRCGRTITGRQIILIELQGTRGKLRLQCPRAGCVSSPGDWVYANPMQTAKFRAESNLIDDKTRTKIVLTARTHHGGRAGKHKSPSRVPFRLAMLRLSLSHPLGSGLHAIRPIV
ncbi:MAG TPA: hypothetical protein VF751_07595 [Chthoniobacterales bacterium]